LLVQRLLVELFIVREEIGMQGTTQIDSVTGPAHGVDRMGHLETRGIDFIPEEERHSRPRNLAWVFFGAEFTYAAFILGALPIVFGLSWWSAFTAILVGSVIGSLAFAGMAVIGPKTGTNGTVSSGAFFGIRGRYVGSFIAQVIDLGFFALTTWAGAEALLAAGHRWFGTGTGNGALAIAMALVAAVTLVIGILGHATLVGYEKFISVSNFLIMALVVALASKHFTVHQAHAQYALGGFSATWMLAVTVAIANATSFGPFASDYSRYIPTDTSPRQVFGGAVGGMFAGNVVALLAGAFIGLSIANPANTVTGIIGIPSPILLIPVVALGFLGNATNGAMCVYNGTLDLQAILWRLGRLNVGLIFGVAGIAVAFLGVIVFDAVESINALVSIVTVLVTPWMAINIIGYLRCRGRFVPHHLQAFGAHTGVYWYKGGVNPRAVFAWVAGVVVGLLFTNTSLLVGPLATSANGVELSFISAAVVGAVLYGLIGTSAPLPVDVEAEPVAVSAGAVG
jgi:purine-cytosine permease-like protein